MRVDYFHTGSAAAETFALDQVYDQGLWAGSRAHLIDPFDLGRYAVKIYDDATGTLIFSKGFDSYFGEYKTSDAGVKGVPRTYPRIGPPAVSEEARPLHGRGQGPAERLEAGLQPDDRPGGHDRHPRAARPGRQGRRGAQVRRAPPQGRRGDHRRGLHGGGGGQVRGRPGPLRRRSSSSSSPTSPTGTSSTSRASSSPRRKAAATSRATARSRRPPSARPSTRSAPSATS